MRLLLTCEDSAEERGSYPIFGYTAQGVQVHREGPGLAAFQQRIPADLRRW